MSGQAATCPSHSTRDPRTPMTRSNSTASPSQDPTAGTPAPRRSNTMSGKQHKRRVTRATAGGAALLLGVGMLPIGLMSAPAANAAAARCAASRSPPGTSQFILDQIKIAEAHATREAAGRGRSPSPTSVMSPTDITGAAGTQRPGGDSAVRPASGGRPQQQPADRAGGPACLRAGRSLPTSVRPIACSSE